MTQIATSPSQSARVIACGVDPMSADMVWQEPITTSQKRTGKILAFRNPNHQFYVGDVPAWSLSALLYALKGVRILVTYLPDTKEWQALSGRPAVVYGAYSDNPIESCVKLIERLTSEGYKLNEIKP